MASRFRTPGDFRKRVAKQNEKARAWLRRVENADYRGRFTPRNVNIWDTHYPPALSSFLAATNGYTMHVALVGGEPEHNPADDEDATNKWLMRQVVERWATQMVKARVAVDARQFLAAVYPGASAIQIAIVDDGPNAVVMVTSLTDDGAVLGWAALAPIIPQRFQTDATPSFAEDSNVA
jgi:hypothetical protein